MRILLLSYSYPPVPLISAQRAYAFHKYLPKDDIQVITITRKWKTGLSSHDDLYTPDEGQIEIEEQAGNKLIRVPFTRNIKFSMIGHINLIARILRKIITLTQTLMQWQCIKFSDYYPLYRACREVLKNEKIDAILVTGQPFILFKYAYKLSDKFKTPYFLDYRDGWYTGHLSDGKGIKGLIRKYEYKQEAKILANASGFTSISKGLVKDIEHSFKRMPEYAIITNGIDEEVLRKVRESYLRGKKKTGTNLETHFEVVYTGTLNDKKRVDILLSGFKRYALGKPRGSQYLKLVGVGMRKHKYEPLIAKYQQEAKWLHILDSVPFESSLKIQMRANVLIALIPGKLSEGIFTGKLFEYAASGRPIIVIENVDNSTKNDTMEDSDLVRQLDLHICNEPKTVATTLEWLSNQKPNHSFRYPAWITRQYQTEILSKFLSSAISSA